MDGGRIASRDPAERVKVQFLRDLFDVAEPYDATVELLAARYGQRLWRLRAVWSPGARKGWPDFVRSGYSGRPAARGAERLRRVRLAVAAEELYGSYAKENDAWHDWISSWI